ncbi:MAG: DUF4105 domain-containing protein [Myxococcaceae bacterium]|nr:DUF4105 domain-containing protein [Myxococcaceae bacterium]
MLCAAAVLLVLQQPWPAPPWVAGGTSRAEDLAITLATLGPGDGVAYMGGHSALGVIDTKLMEGRLYNFGVVEFSPDLMLSFVLGRLDFYADEAAIEQTYDVYRSMDRDVRVQVLNLSPAQALKLANALATGVLPENRTFRYHHFDDNCSTRPRDLIDRVLGGALSRANGAPARMSLREHSRRYTYIFPFLSVWLDYLQNDSVDRKITRYDEGFLPDELERQLDELTVDGQPVVKQKTVLYTSKSNAVRPRESPQWAGWLGVISALAGAAVLLLSRSRKPSARKTLGLVFVVVGLVWGGSGLLLFMLGYFTEHLITHGNENLFFASPLTLALLPLGVMLFRGHPRAVAGLKWVTLGLAALALVGVAVKLLPAFDQANGNVIALALPLTLASAIAFTVRRQPA